MFFKSVLKEYAFFFGLVNFNGAHFFPATAKTFTSLQ